MKVLDRKAVTAQLLIATKIGKCLTTVSDKPDADKPGLTDAEKIAEVASVKDRLMKKWKQIYADYKSKKQVAAVAATSGSSKKSAATESTQKNKPVQIPFIPKGSVDLGENNSEDERRDRMFMIEKFIHKMQTPITKNGQEQPPYDHETLLKGIKAG